MERKGQEDACVYNLFMDLFLKYLKLHNIVKTEAVFLMWFYISNFDAGEYITQFLPREILRQWTRTAECQGLRILPRLSNQLN